MRDTSGSVAILNAFRPPRSASRALSKTPHAPTATPATTPAATPAMPMERGFPYAIRDAIEDGRTPKIITHGTLDNGGAIWVKFTVSDEFPGSGIGTYDLFNHSGITTVGRLWERYSGQKLHDLIEAKTAPEDGTRPPEPERRPRARRSSARGPVRGSGVPGE